MVGLCHGGKMQCIDDHPDPHGNHDHHRVDCQRQLWGRLWGHPGQQVVKDLPTSFSSNSALQSKTYFHSHYLHHPHHHVQTTAIIIIWQIDDGSTTVANLATIMSNVCCSSADDEHGGHCDHHHYVKPKMTMAISWFPRQHLSSRRWGRPTGGRPPRPSWSNYSLQSTTTHDDQQIKGGVQRFKKAKSGV